MKDAYYFSHDCNARNDEKMLQLREKYGYEGYGLFFAIIEVLREATNYKLMTEAMGGLSLALSHPKDKLIAFVNECINIKLFVKNEKYFWSESLLLRMKKRDETRKTLAIAGKKGATVRWGSHSKGYSHPIALKERKGKERKYNIHGDKVRLTDEEYSSLIAEFGKEETGKKIASLDLYICSKGDKYKSHYKTILMWESKNKEPKGGSQWKQP